MGSPPVDRQVEVVPAVSSRELAAAFNIRTQVFVDEQGVPAEMELDQYENVSDHILCTVNHRPVGAARIRKTGQGYKLERFAVLKKYRHLGVGKALVEYCLKNVPGKAHVFLFSQDRVTGFYEKLGFEIAGNYFMEAGIPHVKMIYKWESGGK